MSNKAFFRTALGGFNKQDVIKSIEKLSEDTNRIVSEKETEIKELRETLCENDKKISELQESLSQKDKAISEKDSEIASLSDKVSELELSLEEAKNVPVNTDDSDYKKMYEELLQEITVLRSEKDQLEKSMSTYKEMDIVHHELGTILMRAEKTAREIVSEAKNKAENILSEAKKASDEIFANRRDVCERVKKSFDNSREDIQNVCNNMLSHLENARKSVETFRTSLEIGSKTVNDDMNKTVGEITVKGDN